MKDDERELEEVERALSILGGRHPEQIRAAREDAVAAARRKKELEEESAREANRSRRRMMLVVIATGCVVVVGAVVTRIALARSSEDAEVAPLVARYAALGFDVLPHGSFAAQDRAEVSTIAGDCYVFVAARKSPIRIERPIGSAGAKGEALVCTCAAEAMTVRSTDGAPLRALHIGGSALGGSRALAYRFADHAPTLIAGDDACADDTLASFAQNKRYPKQEADGAWLAAHPALSGSGFTTLASAPARLPFVFVEGSASSCFIASGGELTLWTIGDSVQKPVHAKSAVAWCAVKPATFVVERTGAETVSVVSAPSKRIAGMLGLREILARDSITAATWTRDEDRGEIAADTLRASVVADPVTQPLEAIDARKTRDVRVLVFSIAGQDGWTTDDLDVRCSPALGAAESLCVQPRALDWHPPPPSAICGAALGPLPYWMSALTDAHAIDAELALMAFARRMTARGFSPGVIEGITEKADSVDILGRSGDDAIIAVGLWPVAPFIHPYADEGSAPWTLDGEPHVMHIAAGERVSLPVHSAAAIAPEKRRTVVFRK